MADTVENKVVAKVNALATRMGTECKTLHDKVGTLSGLTTTAKDSIVAALNELDSDIGNIPAASSVIDDSAAKTVTDKTYSVAKIEDVITEAKKAVKDDLLGGAGTAYDTLQELATLIGNNADAIDALETVAGNHVRFDQAQTLTDAQKVQARSNIGAAAASDVGTVANLATDSKSDLVVAINEVNSNADAANNNIGTLENLTTTAKSTLVAAINELDDEIGDIAGADFVATFEAALNPTSGS